MEHTSKFVSPYWHRHLAAGRRNPAKQVTDAIYCVYGADADEYLALLSDNYQHAPLGRLLKSIQHRQGSTPIPRKTKVVNFNQANHILMKAETETR